VFFPQGVSLSFRLPSHEQLSRSASAATYTATDPALASANSQRSPNQSSTSGQNLNAGAEAGLHPSPSLVSVSSGTPKAGDRSSLSPTALKASSVQGKDRRSAYKLGSSKSSKKLHTSASSPGLSSSGTRASFVSDIAPDPPSDGAHSKHKYNTGDLGEGKLFTIPAHLEPVKIKPLGDIQARIRIEAKGPELSAISALVNKVIRTHGMVKAVLRGEGVVVKAYGLKVAAKPFEKDIAFEGLSHLTNVIRFDPTHPGYGLAFGSPVSNRATLNSMLSSVDNRDARRSKFGDLAASGPNQQLLPSALPQHAQRGQKPAKPYSPYTTFVQDLVILSGSPERGIEVAGKVNLPNPSNITVDLTSLEFDLCVPASTVREATGDVRDLIPIGIIHLEPTRLASGDNWIEASGRITLPTLPPGTHPSSQLATILLVGKQFFSGIFENRAMPLFILTPGACSMSPVSNPSRPLLPSAHRRRVCAFPWLADALEGVMIEAVLPAQGEGCGCWTPPNSGSRSQGATCSQDHRCPSPSPERFSSTDSVLVSRSTRLISTASPRCLCLGAPAPWCLCRWARDPMDRSGRPRTVQANSRAVARKQHSHLDFPFPQAASQQRPEAAMVTLPNRCIRSRHWDQEHRCRRYVLASAR